MRIQVINGDGIFCNEGKSLDVTEISSPRSFKEYDINIIYLNTEIWRNDGFEISPFIKEISNFETLHDMIENDNESNIIIVYPQNIPYFLIDSYSNSVERVDALKNQIFRVTQNIREIHGSQLEIYYNSSELKIKNTMYKYDFTFKENPYINFPNLKNSDKNERNTAIMGNVSHTTLDIDSMEKIIIFAEAIGIYNKDISDKPDWIGDISMFDDDKIMKNNEEQEKKIKMLEENIQENNIKLEKNERYKSILYSNGDFLVEVVFEIISDMLGWDLSEFIDKKKEDFKYINEKLIYIGEIKGVTSNVKSEHISQLDVHKQTYLDENERIHESNVKSLLIINPERKKKPSCRDAIHERQEKIAKRNDSLIITTEILLKMYEQYLLSSDDDKKEIRKGYINLINTKIGVLRETDLK